MDDSERDYWLSGLSQFDVDNEMIALAVMCAFTKPQTWLDVGCGTGAVVRTARTLGIDAYGIDQMQEDAEHFKRVDLCEPLDLGRKFELVTCIEVAEHLHAEYEGVLCDTLARHVIPGGILVFTAAPPGQDGYNHFNLQPKKYWTDRLQSRGLVLNVAYTERMALMWKYTHSTLNHLHKNVQVFNQPL